MTAPSVLVFDVNETLLDIAGLEPWFTIHFGSRQVMREWFADLVLYSQTATLAGRYAPFGPLGVGVLRMLADAKGVDLTDESVDAFTQLVASFPAHADVRPALERLRGAGFRLVTLTNSAPDAQREKLEGAGIADLFERLFSVEAVERFKPAPETYRHVAAELGVETRDLALVAAHIWDTIGAQSVGCAGVFVVRSGNAPLPVDGLPQPDLVAPDLGSAADQMIGRWR